jgi:osmotically-inducible protein OsmY
MKEDMMPEPANASEERWLHGAAGDSGHRGKGPKNYQRSDQRVFEDVCEALAHDDAIDASDIEVTVHGGEVVLDGSVLSRTMKEHAEGILAGVPGVKSVRNLLRTRITTDTRP